MLVIVKYKKKCTPVMRHKICFKNIFFYKKKYFISKDILVSIKKRVGIKKGRKLINRGEFFKKTCFYMIKKLFFLSNFYFITYMFKKKLKHFIICKNFFNILCMHKLQFSLIGEIIFLNVFKVNKFINILYKNFFFFFYKNKINFLKYNILPLWLCKTGFYINNISYLSATKLNSFLAKSPGSVAKIFSYSKKNSYLTIKLPSFSFKSIKIDMFCYIGKNCGESLKILGKMKIKLRLSKKPIVRGIAKNPVDHPHGGRSNINKPEISPWFWVAKHKH